MNWISKFVAWFGLGLSWVLVQTPLPIRYGIGSFLGILWFDVFRIRRQVVFSNIEKAFPNLPKEERVRLGRQSLMNLGKNVVEYSYLPFLASGKLDELFGFENIELINEGLNRKKGVILLTCHLGNGDLACAGLARRGYSVLMVSKFFKLKWLNDLWFGMRRRVGLEFIPPRDSSFALLRALKQNSIVVIPLDQFTGPPIGVKTTFFGHETGTAAGLAVMAERAGSPVIACYTHRTPDGRHVLSFRQSIDVNFNGDRARGMVEYTQKFNDILEGFVREHPDQWMWIHKRWKRFVVT